MFLNFRHSLFFLFVSSFIALPQAASENTSLPAYWFWAGRSVLSDVPTNALFYIHQGTIERGSGRQRQPSFQPQGAAPVALRGRGILLVFRVEDISSSLKFSEKVIFKIKTWEAKGNQVLGVQIDYDSPTRALAPYVDFLKLFRQDLPSEYQLSVTGLADWAANASEETMLALSGVADEIVFQLYNGRREIPDLENYLRRMTRVNMPFRIGLLDNQEISLEQRQKLQNNPSFKGWVYFLPGVPLGQKPDPIRVR